MRTHRTLLVLVATLAAALATGCAGTTAGSSPAATVTQFVTVQPTATMPGPTATTPGPTTPGPTTPGPTAPGPTAPASTAPAPTTTRPTTTRPGPTVAVFTGHYTGHTVSLTVTAGGVGRESVGSGCCDPVLDLTYQLSDVHGTDPVTATATVTTVRVHAGWSTAEDGAPPRPGQRGTVTLSRGVLTDHLDHERFCGAAAEAEDRCGA